MMRLNADSYDLLLHCKTNESEEQYCISITDTKTIKLCVAPKSQGEKVCEIKGGSQEIAMMIV